MDSIFKYLAENINPNAYQIANTHRANTKLFTSFCGKTFLCAFFVFLCVVLFHSVGFSIRCDGSFCNGISWCAVYTFSIPFQIVPASECMSLQQSLSLSFSHSHTTHIFLFLSFAVDLMHFKLKLSIYLNVYLAHYQRYI